MNPRDRRIDPDNPRLCPEVTREVLRVGDDPLWMRHRSNATQRLKYRRDGAGVREVKGRARRFVTDLVESHPGLTANELAAIGERDKHRSFTSVYRAVYRAARDGLVTRRVRSDGLVGYWPPL